MFMHPRAFWAPRAARHEKLFELMRQETLFAAEVKDKRNDEFAGINAFRDMAAASLRP